MTSLLTTASTLTALKACYCEPGLSLPYPKLALNLATARSWHVYVHGASIIIYQAEN